jgi:hypothetical protein
MKTASDNESSSFISSVSDPNSFSPDAESDDDASLFSSKAGMEDDEAPKLVTPQKGNKIK